MVINGLLALSESDLAALKGALRTGRLLAPFLPMLIERIVPRAVSGDVSTALQRMAASGANREGLVAAIELLAAARAQQPSIDEVIELVTTGPEAGAVTNRDTQVVVQELFRNAEHSVLVAGYELYQAEPVFRTLADRMADEPRPAVRMFLNVKRPFGETSTDSEIIASFAYRFRTEHWATDRPLPEIYFDPRSLRSTQNGRRFSTPNALSSTDGSHSSRPPISRKPHRNETLKSGSWCDQKFSPNVLSTFSLH